MTNEAHLTKKVAILTEQYRNINEAYVEALSELLVARETIQSLQSQVSDLLTNVSDELEE